MRSFDARGRSSERSTRLDGSGGERWTAIIESSRESCNRRLRGGRGERGIVCCGIVGPSWKCSTCSRETVSRASLSLALSYTTVYKLSAERVLPLGCCFSLRRGEVLLYRAYPRRDIERIYVYICILAFPLSFMIHLPPPLYNNARPPPSFVIYTSLNFEPSSPPFFSQFILSKAKRESKFLPNVSFFRRN